MGLTVICHNMFALGCMQGVCKKIFIWFEQEWFALVEKTRTSDFLPEGPQQPTNLHLLNLSLVSDQRTRPSNRFESEFRIM